MDFYRKFACIPDTKLKFDIVTSWISREYLLAFDHFPDSYGIHLGTVRPGPIS
jgi:hypothetical protein